MKLGATILHLTKLKRKNGEWDIPAYSRLPLWLRYWFDADLRDAQRFDYHYVCTLCLQSWDVAPGQPWPAVEDPAQAAKIRRDQRDVQVAYQEAELAAEQQRQHEADLEEARRPAADERHQQEYWRRRLTLPQPSLHRQRRSRISFDLGGSRRFVRRAHQRKPLEDATGTN